MDTITWLNGRFGHHIIKSFLNTKQTEQLVQLLQKQLLQLQQLLEQLQHLLQQL